MKGKNTTTFLLYSIIIALLCLLVLSIYSRISDGTFINMTQEQNQNNTIEKDDNERSNESLKSLLHLMSTDKELTEEEWTLLYSFFNEACKEYNKR